MSEPIALAKLGVALDEAEANGLHPEFVALLKAMVGKADLLERFVGHAEHELRYCVWHGEYNEPRDSPLFALVAEHRGETPEATLARLSPPPAPASHRYDNVVGGRMLDVLGTAPGVDLPSFEESLGPPTDLPPAPPRMRIGRHFTEAELEEIRNLGLPLEPRANPDRRDEVIFSDTIYDEDGDIVGFADTPTDTRP